MYRFLNAVVPGTFARVGQATHNAEHGGYRHAPGTIMSELLSVTPYPVLSLVLLLLLGMLLGYLARRPAHRLLTSVFRELERLLRLVARYTGQSAERTGGWTSNLALDGMRRRLIRDVHWNHDRLISRAEQDMADLPLLRQRLLARITDLEESLQRSAEVPAEPPAWGRISQTLARAEQEQDGEMQKILADIRDNMAQYRSDARQVQRESAHRRYLILYRMLPRWRQVHDLLDNVEQRIGRLQTRVDQLRRRIAEFSSLRQASQRQVVSLVTGGVWRFVLATVGLLLAAAAIAVLFSLVTGPMQSLLGDSVLVADIPMYPVTGGILVGFQLILGLLMLESIRGSDLLPMVSGQAAGTRRLIFACAFGLLLLLSAAGAVLYYLLGEAAAVNAASSSLFPEDSVLVLILATASNALMVFLLPFALVLAGIPLATAAHHAGTVLGVFLTLALHLVSLVARLAGAVIHVIGRLAIQSYDLLIFIPLWLERELPSLRTGRSGVVENDRLRAPVPAAGAPGRERAPQEPVDGSRGAG